VKTWSDKREDYKEDMARIHAERAKRLFLYFPKGAVGGFMFGKLTKAYTQEPNQFRKNKQEVWEVTTQVIVNGKPTPMEVSWSDSATAIETDGKVHGPTGIIGKYVCVLCHGINEGGYNSVTVFADSDAKELMQEVKESPEYVGLVANSPDYSIGYHTWYEGINTQIEKFMGANGENKKDDDIPF
jgi:hypothetical protein